MVIAAQLYEYTKKIKLYTVNGWIIWFLNYINKTLTDKQ